MRKNTSHRLQKLSHYVIGFAIFMEGVVEADDFTHSWPYVILFCSIGVLIFAFTLYEKKIERTWVKIPPLIQILESIVLLFIGIRYIQHQKQWLPYVVFLTAAASLTAGIVRYLKLQKGRRSP